MKSSVIRSIMVAMAVFMSAQILAAETADVTVPAAVNLFVYDIGSSTDSASQSVSATDLTLDAGNALKISLQADAADFTPPVDGATTWSAGNISWNAATWTTGTGASGTLSNTGYNEVARSNVDATSCSTSNLVFTLAAKSTVSRAGAHTLSATWKFESFTP